MSESHPSLQSLESAIRAGDPDATLASLRAETAEQRAAHRADLMRMLKLVQAARWGDSSGEWGEPPTQAQQRSLGIAIVLCGTAKDVIEAMVEDELLVALAREFRPRSLDGLADAMLKHSPQWIRAVRPVMASPVKGQLEAAMKLLDRLVEREPSLATQASATIAMGLLHEAAPVQVSVLRRLEAWGVDANVRARLAEFASTVAAVNRPRLLQLIGAAEPPAAPDAAPSAAVPPPRVHPLDDERRLAPIADLHELVECIAHVFENAGDVDAFERAAAELVRIAPIAAADKPLFAPVRKRAARLQKLLPRELARLLLFVLDGTRAAGHAGRDPGGNASPLDDFINQRIDALMDVAAQGRRLVPLSAPTHRGGFIAADVFIDRVAAHRAAGLVSSETEQVCGLLRLAPDAAAALHGRARALPDDAFTRALRYALGDDISPGAQRELFAAAARIRYPRADDTRLDARHPDLGPDGALAARYAWHLNSRSHAYEGKTYTHHDLLLGTQAVPDDLPDTRLAVRRHPPGAGGRKHYRWWSFAGIDEGAIRSSATLLPSDPEAFFAEGARAIGNNLDWSEAQWQNRAYLELLLDPVTQMTPMACLLLVLGLAGKEPGQTAISVDALVRAHVEGRLHPSEGLADTLRAVLATPLVKAARLHKSLLAATRADAQMHVLVFDLLCAAVQARPGDPPRDIGLLLDLLLELKVSGARALPPATRTALADMKLTGNARALQRRLLA